MPQILIVENGRVIPLILKKRIEAELHFDVEWVQTYAECVKLVDSGKYEFLVALVGLYLSDAPNGEIVDYFISQKIPVVVFSGEFDEEIRMNMWSKHVVDYVLKEGKHNIDYIVYIIKRLHNNRSIKILVVDDSHVVRKHVCNLLRVHLYNVLEAEDGDTALKILEENPDIKMVITDFHMPKMDGFQLSYKIREKYTKEDIAIIGMSGSNSMSARFIKYGANDFVSKDFFSEEFYCRISQNIEVLEYIKEIKEASNRDYLTGLYNRRYFYDSGYKLYANYKRDYFDITIAMLDIDFFKNVNDSYGHDAGDKVLKFIANLLKVRFRESDIVARMGGEEFCILASNMKKENIFNIFDDIRKKIGESDIMVGNFKINITVSIGICSEPLASLDEMIKLADTRLYKAKESGRNLVILE